MATTKKTNSRRKTNKTTDKTANNTTTTTAVVAVSLSELTTDATPETIQAAAAGITDAEALLTAWNKFAKANKSNEFKTALSADQLKTIQTLVAEQTAKDEAEKAAALEAERKAIEAAKERAAAEREAAAAKAVEASEKRLTAAIETYNALRAESSDNLPRLMSTSTAIQPYDFPEYVVIRGKVSVSASGIETHKTLLLPANGFRSTDSVLKAVFNWFAAAQIVAESSKTALTDETGCAYLETTTKKDGTTVTKVITVGGSNPFRAFLQGRSIDFIDSATGEILRIECEETLNKTVLKDAAKAVAVINAANSNRGRKHLWNQTLTAFLISCQTLKMIRRTYNTLCI